MSKCWSCATKKGKRDCLLSEQPICSACCGQQRQADTCATCPYYAPPKRHYAAITRYTPSEIDEQSQLTEIAMHIESAFVQCDWVYEKQLRDKQILGVIEALLDHYHFNDPLIAALEAHQASWFNVEAEQLLPVLKGYPVDTITRVIGTIYFVARRRSAGRREYLDFIAHFVGVPVNGIEDGSARLVAFDEF